MPKPKTVTAELVDRKVVVSEVKVKEILDVLSFFKKDNENEQGGSDKIQALMLKCCGMKPDDLADLYPSDLETLWESFRKVNSFFFRTAEWLNLKKHLPELFGSMMNGFGSELSSLLKEDIKKFLNMDGQPSLEPPNTPTELKTNE
jgi:hypothetical protein